MSISFYISNLTQLLESLIFSVWYKIMTVNQRVLGSSQVEQRAPERAGTEPSEILYFTVVMSF